MPFHRINPWLYWPAMVGLFAGALGMTFAYAPTEATMGESQKIFYLHLPVALNMFASAGVVFIGSIAYIWSRDPRWDQLAAAAGEVTVLLSSVVLITGMIWARSAWGVWWTWSPRLTFSLLLWLLYLVYLVLRPSIPSTERRALVSAVYGSVAFLDVPLVYLSVRLLPDIHPTSASLEPAMRITLVVWCIPVTMLAGGLIAARYALARRTDAESGALNPGEERAGDIPEGA